MTIIFAIYNMSRILKKVEVNEAFFIGYSLAQTQRLLDFRATNAKVIITFSAIFLLVKFLIIVPPNVSIIFLVVFSESFHIILGFKAEKVYRSLHHNLYKSKTQLEKFKIFLTEFLPNQMAIFTQDLRLIPFINNAFKKSFHCKNADQLKSSLKNLALDEQEIDKHKNLLKLIGCSRNGSSIKLLTLLEKIMARIHLIKDIELLDFQVYEDQLCFDLKDEKRVPNPKEEKIETTERPLGTHENEENNNKNHLSTARRVFKVRIIPLVWDDQNSFCLILDDVTHERTIMELKIADRNKDLVIAMVSHELRTPLNGILGLLEIIGKSLRQPEIRPYLEACKNSGLMLLNLVNSILDMSQIRENKLQLTYTRICLLDLLDEVKSLFDHFCKAKSLYFNIEVHPDVPFDIITDETRLRQILINLAGNAFKFTFKGGILIKVDLENKQPCRLKFTIQDTGIGIKKEDLQKLFKLFGRLEQHNKKINTHGVGLGLTISNTIVMQMDPSQEKRGIQVSSELGEGTAFSFIISADSQMINPQRDLIQDQSCLSVEDETENPFDIFERLNAYDIQSEGQKSPTLRAELLRSKTRIQSKHLLTNLDSKSSIPAGGGPDTLVKFNPLLAPAEPSQNLPSSKIKNPQSLFKNLGCLIVDDNPFNLMVATNIMQEQGFTITTALNGLEALQKVKEHQFSLILMDCQMPVMDGYETTRQLKTMMKSGEICETPVVALTANNRDEEHDKLCEEAGMDDIIGKPLNKAELNAKLKQLLSLPI